MRQVLYRFADFAQRFVLRGVNDGSQQTVLERDRDGEIHIGVLHNRIFVKGSVDLRNFYGGGHGSL